MGNSDDQDTFFSDNVDEGERKLAKDSAAKYSINVLPNLWAFLEKCRQCFKLINEPATKRRNTGLVVLGCLYKFFFSFRMELNVHA